jgi:hypothetical protein
VAVRGIAAGAGAVLGGFWCWIREGIVVVVGCDINVVVTGVKEIGLHSMGEEVDERGKETE